ncbi:MAG: hypothetical protein WHV66_00290 [Anaerolineales bacterium]
MTIKTQPTKAIRMKKVWLLCPAISIALFVAIAILGVYWFIELVWQPYASTYGSPLGEIQVWIAIKDRLDGYLEPLSKNDIQKALQAWELPDKLPTERLSALNERKQEITAFLAKSKVDSTYSILDMQRWSPNCCEISFPGITDSYISAIGVRLKVQWYTFESVPFPTKTF